MVDEAMRTPRRADDLAGIVSAALRRGLTTLSLEELEDVDSSAKNWVWRTEERIISERRDAFLAAGGCPSCNGHGWVVVWDTMDSMSGAYAEHGPCPRSPEGRETPQAGYLVKDDPSVILGACTAETREKTGLSTAMPKSYRGIGQSVKGDTLRDFPLTESETREMGLPASAMAACQAEREARRVDVGRPVRVVNGFTVKGGKRKGRHKLPLGLEGVVEWKGDTRYGVCVRIRFGEEESMTDLTGIGNVEVIR